MDNGKKLLMTMTGEIHQPVRLYYEVYDQAKVFKSSRPCGVYNSTLTKSVGYGSFRVRPKSSNLPRRITKFPNTDAR
jgi:hypothetical protein